MRLILYFVTCCFLLISCSPTRFKNRWTQQKAPEQFTATFHTTEGNFTLEANRNWSPAGVDRFYQLIRRRYFTDVPVYRVVPAFVAQFGQLDSLKKTGWESHPLPDEPVEIKNTMGTLSYARSGKNTRSTQFYINLTDNPKLDTSGQTRGVTGFPVIGKVVSGMEVVLQFFPYQDTPRKSLPKGMEALPYFKEQYPKMGIIRKVEVRRNKK